MNNAKTKKPWCTSDLFLTAFMHFRAHPYNLKLNGRYVVAESDLTSELMTLITEYNSDVDIPILQFVEAYRAVWLKVSDLKKAEARHENTIPAH